MPARLPSWPQQAQVGEVTFGWAHACRPVRTTPPAARWGITDRGIFAEVAETRVKALGMLSGLGLVPGQPAPPAPDLNAQHGVAEALAERNTRLASFWIRPQELEPDPYFVGRTALVVDAEDQFTQMLAHQLRHRGLHTDVARWGKLTDVSGPDLVVFGPGPGDPREQADKRIKTLQRLMRSRLDSGKAMLAVCLSHQILAQLAGLPVEKLPSPRQGTSLRVDIFGKPAYVGFYNTFSAVSSEGQTTTPSLGLEICSENGIVNALRGSGIASVQGHLESVLSPDGLLVLERLVWTAIETAPINSASRIG
jgi:phenazine biosynthesis protein phzE